jgi:hypothetical protein
MKDLTSEYFEKVYRPTDLIAMNTDTGVMDTTLHNLLNTLGLTDKIVKQDLCLEYLYDGDEIDISEIHNNETGEVYWEDHDKPWSSIDETLVDSLLMWGEIE